ncbi:flagellar assembly protein T N-terminal domain-containing protein [Thiomicrorhabdus heinhorstiae]|uniref:Flagellar assembly protein T N-terminal domain-containing protein n=1 Tax=Thiomicrorhabdus heinhorstiae TaxID=2748010 RepID=A0ABS0C0S6_9GAMM|nr:flagellar assembly protein T N-terminal domain-containing protein [Thiomicrorhabdus heinhorstiae]MBF6058686.1 hypothetical protein [Thiomicrorhabdus heinhorstiae]
MSKTSSMVTAIFGTVLTVAANLVIADESLPGDNCFEVTGVASMQGVSEGFAKKMAIRDALKSASMRQGLQVRSQTTMNQMQITNDRARFETSSKVENFTVLQAGIESSEDIYGQPKPKPLNYEVHLLVCMGEAAKGCGTGGKSYQARLLVAPLAVEDVASVSDIRGVVQGYSLALMDELRAQGYRNLELSQSSSELIPNRAVTPNLDRNLLNNLYERSGAQYALLSVLRSASTDNASSETWNRVKRFYNVNVEPNQRFLKLDTYLVDLLQARIERHFEQGVELNGEVLVGRQHPFGSAAFWQTLTGKGFLSLLETSSQDAEKSLKCKPFQASIAEIRGKEYFIYLNQASGIEVGDELAVYHKVDRPVNYAGKDLGSDLQPGAFLKVTRVLNDLAIAEVSESGGIVISIGDRVTPW